MPDDAARLARLNLKVDIFERPQSFARRATRSPQSLERFDHRPGDKLAEAAVRGEQSAYLVSLTEIFDFDDRSHTRA